jgi:nicotinate-nucleotide adenylyltransferase
MRIGILGGTFDPVHVAHLRLAEEAAERFDLDRVELVLSSVPPHKDASEITPAWVRWELLNLACENNDKLRPSDIEINRPGESYTVDTIRDIRAGLSAEDEVYLLIGMDCACEIETWKSYRTILETSNVVVASRRGCSEESLPESLRGRVRFLDMTALEVSSTRIRDLVRRGHSIRYLVPEPVRRRILELGAYTSQRPDPGLREVLAKGRETCK